jgi:hypothetical protein
MLQVKTHQDVVRIGEHFSVSFQRTLRIPDDGNTYPLPPGLGKFPVCRVEDFADRVPEAWNEHGGVFIPMYQREAMWLSFEGADWRPNAVKVAIGKVDAISGKTLNGGLNRTPKHQNYVVCPDQPWLDGINAGNGYIRQFVAMPLGMGYTVEGQVTGKEEFGGIQIVAFAPKPGKFPDEPPMVRYALSAPIMYSQQPCTYDMGLGAGGKMRQKIYPDDYGVDTWDQKNFGRIYVHIVNSMMYREITGIEPPPTPVTSKSYTQCGLPWFDLYDEDKGDLQPSDDLAKIKSIKEMDAGKGFLPQQDDTSVGIIDEQVMTLNDAKNVTDGNW